MIDTNLTPFSATEHPHRRYNPLSGEWILVSPHRTKRPWQGQVEKPVADTRPAYDPTCYLCPGNERAGGAAHNPAYADTFVFENDFAALLPDEIEPSSPIAPLLQAETVRGTCRVICFSPRHNLTLPEMPLPAIRRVVDTWATQTAELGARYRWVQLFENKGAIMGCSNPHPHGQVWAMDTLPNEARKEDEMQRVYFDANGTVLLHDYVNLEQDQRERIVVENETWVTVVPYWAFWPYETMLLPRRHVRRLPDLNDGERDGLADILKQLLSKYDNLFETSFPYSMGWHGAPFMAGDQSHWQLHAHFYPPLLRSATVKKFRVGFEMLSESQRDLTAEQAAATLCMLSDIHYKQR